MFATEVSPTGLLWQKEQPLFWVHLPATPNKILPLYPLLIAQGILLGIRTAV